MSNRAQGRRKSKFPGIDGIPADATLDFVSGGVNYKIPKAEFLAALNVVGTIEQSGDPLAVPILDTQGSVHLIRNLETSDTSGLKASVSPLNGLKLTLDAQAGAPGTPVLNSSNKVRSIKSGGGISVTLDGDSVVVSLAGAVADGLTTGIVAFAGGGQADAVELTTDFNQVGTVASAGDSIKLPVAVAETTRIVINSGANALDLYPGTGGSIDGAAVNTPINVAVNGTVTLYAYDAINWVQI